MPLPSIAVNDPWFRNNPDNDWSGQPQGLTFQRSIRALENYGHYAELTLIGQTFLDIVSRTGKFAQQYDPFTCKADTSKDGYGPTLLTVLEFISRLYGVSLADDTVYWSCLKTPYTYVYKQVWNGNTYLLDSHGDQVVCSINGKQIFTVSKGVRVVTDLNGKVSELIGIAPANESISFCRYQECLLNVQPNMVYRMNADEILKVYKTVKYFPPHE